MHHMTTGNPKLPNIIYSILINLVKQENDLVVKKNDETNNWKNQFNTLFFLRDYTITASLKILSENPVKKSWWKKKLQCKTRKATYLDANKI